MTRKLSLQDLCKELEKEELIELVKHLAHHYVDIDMAVMEWYALQKGIEKKDPLSNKLLWEYWERAEDIISDFNKYGGGPEHLEYEAYEYLEKITDLLSQFSIPADKKRLLINKLFTQYALGNSGFEDVLIDKIYELCESDSDWEYVITLFQKEPSTWNQKCIMRIYKDQLQDGEAYLQMRLQSLEYGMDYWDLAAYYISQGQIDKAIEVAEAGIENGQGRKTELFAFLFDYYVEQDEITQIQAVVDMAFQKQSDIGLICDRTFRYFKRKNKYEELKNILVRAFRTDYHNKNHYEDFNSMKEQLSAEDWAEVQEEMLGIVQKENMRDYLEICYDMERYDEILETILEPSRYTYTDWDSLADKLVDQYPREIIEYYWNKGCSFIPNGNRKSYRESITYFKKVRNIYDNKLNEYEVWQSRLEALEIQYRNRRAFLDEMSVFG
ncbi:hypothetical protein M3215_16075 [Bacillus cytotoxicus]|uniref:Uncharacterized protein n=1 Tax=Bacillus cytotoxicus TaxID=580165 RepID=A0ACC6AAI3_9BACI|nr:hypothetical protein [Bacillus cytotoxicus]